MVWFNLVKSSFEVEYTKFIQSRKCCNQAKEMFMELIIESGFDKFGEGDKTAPTQFIMNKLSCQAFWDFLKRASKSERDTISEPATVTLAFWKQCVEAEQDAQNRFRQWDSGGKI